MKKKNSLIKIKIKSKPEEIPFLAPKRSNCTSKMTSTLADHFDQRFTLNYHNTNVKNAITIYHTVTFDLRSLFYLCVDIS